MITLASNFDLLLQGKVPLKNTELIGFGAIYHLRQRFFNS